MSTIKKPMLVNGEKVPFNAVITVEGVEYTVSDIERSVFAYRRIKERRKHQYHKHHSSKARKEKEVKTQSEQE